MAASLTFVRGLAIPPMRQKPKVIAQRIFLGNYCAIPKTKL
jgi:hypothetical protein